ncbi:MAG: hypothetical protein PVJ86_13475 [Phycisphaerales bacterium]|jgi:hypothetical protein
MAIFMASGDEWISLVLEKLGIDPRNVNRVVIDARADGPLMLYITHFGTKDLLEVRPPEAHEVEIVVNE